MTKLLKRIGLAIARAGFILFITFLLFEVTYRVYVIDYYGGTFEYLNNDFEEKPNAKELLLVGDSFSAFKEGYAIVIYDSLSGYNVNNISVPGTSVREQYLFGRHYLKSKKPEALIFQYYVGNDLLGWDHPMNWEEVSTVRNVY